MSISTRQNLPFFKREQTWNMSDFLVRLHVYIFFNCDPTKVGFQKLILAH